MSRPSLTIARAGLVLLTFTVFMHLLSVASAFSNGQAAVLVLGQSDFTGNLPKSILSGTRMPADVAVDSTSGAVFVADEFNNRVLRFTSSTARTNGAAADGVFSDMGRPSGVAVDAGGRLWVADSGRNRVLRFDDAVSRPSSAVPDGVLGQPDFATYTAQGVMGATATGMYFPRGVGVDTNGRVWVADSGNHRVLRFDNAVGKANGAAADGVLGQPDFTSNAPARTASGMSSPSGVAVDATGRLWVADSSNSRVLRFDNAVGKANGAVADGVLGQSNFTSSIAAATINRMSNPNNVDVDAAGHLWVADKDNHRTLRFNNAAGKANGASADGVLGQPDFISRNQATTATGMNFPGGVAVDSTGNLWVADTNNNRVLRFDSGAAQTIVFAPLPQKVVGDPPFVVSATASSGLAVTFSSATNNVCTMSGNTVTLVASGVCTINANQPGDTNYADAPTVSQSFTVLPSSTLQKVYLPLAVR